MRLAVRDPAIQPPVDRVVADPLAGFTCTIPTPARSTNRSQLDGIGASLTEPLPSGD
jgi:hypothetical protein